MPGPGPGDLRRKTLKIVPIDNGKPEDGDGGITPSAETIAGGTYQPLSRPLFIYVKEKSLSRPEVKAFVEFYLNEGAALSREVGYIELPAGAYELALDNVRTGKLGTGFGGTPEVGLKVEELLAREGKL